MSFDPNVSQRKSLGACEGIAAFYEKIGVPYRKTVGIFEGVSYTWFVRDDEQKFNVRCTSRVRKLGYGVLMVEYRDFSPIRFVGSPEVDPNTGKLHAVGLFGKEHETFLPMPRKKGKTDCSD